MNWYKLYIYNKSMLDIFEEKFKVERFLLIVMKDILDNYLFDIKIVLILLILFLLYFKFKSLTKALLNVLNYLIVLKI